MTPFLWAALIVFWAAWFYPYLFLAPHGQKRESITARNPTLVGLLLEAVAIFMAFNIRLASNIPRSNARLAVFAVCGIIGSILFWTAVTHLGLQFRITAGLYHDHQLVTSGPYSIVRHPVYTSLLAMLISTSALLTPLPWAAAALVVFVTGTEIRVHTEDRLLASRFGAQFQQYRKSVSAYLPLVR